MTNKRVLDIGAGTGAFAIPLMKEGAYVTAVDSSLYMIQSLVHRTEKLGLDNIDCILSPFHRVKTKIII